MPIYEYLALDNGGSKIKGVVDAASAVAARQKLRDSSIYPVELNETESKGRGKSAPSGRSGLFGKVRLKDISIMTRQLSTLLSAGLPLVPSLTTLVSQTTHPQLKKTLARIKEEVNEGNSLAAGMSLFPQIFSPFYINMVKAGEASGMINLVLERLADFNESQQALRSKIRAALAYPLIMFLIGALVIFFLVTFVVPNITQIFEEMHQTLPLVTIVLIAVSSFLKSFWWLLAGLVGIAFFTVQYTLLRTEKGKYLWDKIKFKAPVIGILNQKIAVARFSRTLGTLLQSGVPLLTSLEIVANVVNNRLMADAIRQAAKDVEEGQSLSLPLRKNKLFPPLASEMIAVGEQSGTVEIMLQRIADAFETETSASIMTMTSLLEPLMILVMGFMVGFIVISVLLPIFEMNQLVK
ncbi:MAG: type II secretion system inner membrane protein GspF [Deltaproteobacteria bacterium]|nr:type II secretion system inner membrane protein GspF [Deltaproteobacteria bacterium]